MRLSVIYKFSLYGFLKNLRFFEPFFLLFFLSKGLTYTQIGVLISVREITSNIFEIPSGIFSDYYSPRKSLILCFILYITAFASINAASGSFNLTLAGMFFFGIAESFRSGTHKAIIMNYLEENNMISRKHEIYGYTRSWSLKGSAVSAVISGIIVFFSGNYDLLFIFSTFPYFLALILILTYPENRKNPEKNPTVKIHAISLWKELKKDNILKSIINTSLFEADFKFVKDLIQPIIQTSIALFIVNETYIKSFSGIILGIIYFFIYIFSSIISEKSHSIISKTGFSEEYILNSSLVIFSIFTFLCGISIDHMKTGFFPVMLLGINFLLFNLRKPLGISYVSGITAKEHRAGVLSVEAQLKTLFLSIFAVICGILIDRYGLSSAFIFISVFLFIFSFFIRIKKRPQ